VDWPFGEAFWTTYCLKQGEADVRITEYRISKGGKLTREKERKKKERKLKLDLRGIGSNFSESREEKRAIS